MTGQLIDYECGPKDWFESEGIGWDDLPAGESGSQVRWRTRGTEALPFDE